MRTWISKGPLPELRRFEVLRPLGRGGMGAVWVVRDRETDERFALKELTRCGSLSLLLFKREFRILRDIAHPNLVRLHEPIEEGGRWFLTMEIVDGVDFLRHVAAPDGRAWGFDEARLRDALGQLARGLDTLHAAGKVHRDLKPSNVLVSNEGRVVILDFGLASEAKHDEIFGEDIAVGTPAYMAPEQVTSSASASPAARRADRRRRGPSPHRGCRRLDDRARRPEPRAHGCHLRPRLAGGGKHAEAPNGEALIVGPNAKGLAMRGGTLESTTTRAADLRVRSRGPRATGS